MKPVYLYDDFIAISNTGFMHYLNVGKQSVCKLVVNCIGKYQYEFFLHKCVDIERRIFMSKVKIW